jgi:hypothetical protein
MSNLLLLTPNNQSLFFFFFAPLIIVTTSNFFLTYLTRSFLCQLFNISSEHSREQYSIISNGIFIIYHWILMWLCCQYYHGGKKEEGWQSWKPKFGYQLDKLPGWKRGFTFVFPVIQSVLTMTSIGRCLPWQAFVASALMGIPTGLLEELFWRALLDQVGKDAKLTNNQRTLFTAGMFSAWHITWCFYCLPTERLPTATIQCCIATFIFGSLWSRIIQHDRNNWFAISVAHSIFVIGAIFPQQIFATFGVGDCQPMPDFFGTGSK